MKYLAFFLGITENHMEVKVLVRTNVLLNIKDDFEVIEVFFFFCLIICGTWLNLLSQVHHK